MGAALRSVANASQAECEEPSSKRGVQKNITEKTSRDVAESEGALLV